MQTPAFASLYYSRKHYSFSSFRNLASLSQITSLSCFATRRHLANVNKALEPTFPPTTFFL